MHQYASGGSAAVSLLGGNASGPPVGPETVGRPPSNFEPPPVPLRPFPTAASAPAAPAAPAPAAEAEQEAEIEELPAAAEVRRLVVRFLGGDEIEVGTFDEREDAMTAAQELVGRFSTAEAAGEWPELDGRFLRPGAVASIDVLLAD
jgi:hypothetical protein